MMCRNFWGCASRYNDRSRWCHKGEAWKGDVKTSPAKNSMDRVNPEKAYLNRWAKRRQNNKIIARRSSLSDWFETWWQMLRNNMSSKKNRLVSLFLDSFHKGTPSWYFWWPSDKNTNKWLWLSKFNEWKESCAWSAFVETVKNFLGNRKAINYKGIVAK